MLKFTPILVLFVFYFQSALTEKSVSFERIEELDDDDTIEEAELREIRNDFGSIIMAGVELSDPLSIPHVEGNVATLKYEVTNNTIASFGKCTLKKIALNLEELTASMKFFCPYLKMIGKYEVSGLMIILPVEGKGDYQIDVENYGIEVNTGLKQIKSRDGREHLKIKNYSLKLDVKGPVKFNLTNLFYGDEQASKAAHEFANKNWEPVTELIQGPHLYACMKKVLKNINKCLKPVPMEDLLAK